MYNQVNVKKLSINGYKGEKLIVNTLYRTKNLALHREFEVLKHDANSRKRQYTISWFNPKNEVFKLISIENVKIEKIKLAIDLIQNSKYDLNDNSFDLGENKEFRSLCFDLKRELNYYKGVNL